MRCNYRGFGNPNPKDRAGRQVHFVEAPVVFGHLGACLPEGRQLLNPFRDWGLGSPWSTDNPPFGDIGIGAVSAWA